MRPTLRLALALLTLGLGACAPSSALPAEVVPNRVYAADLETAAHAVQEALTRTRADLVDYERTEGAYVLHGRRGDAYTRSGGREGLLEQFRFRVHLDALAPDETRVSVRMERAGPQGVRGATEYVRAFFDALERHGAERLR